MNKSLLYILLIYFSTPMFSKVWNVGGESEYKFCSQVEGLAENGDTIIIAEDTYNGDRQVTWSKNNLLIRGTGKNTILVAGESIANDQSNGKGIFVIKGSNTTVENITFSNAKVESGNGAGIRLEGVNLDVRYCRFFGNEMGILQGGKISDCRVLIEYCEFNNNGNSKNPGYQHNIYINYVDTLIFRFNLSMNAVASGHEFKSRAYNSFIMYNRISNTNSVDSRNIDLPNGGTAVIVGNIIEQGEESENSNIIGYGLEGLKNPTPNNLWIANNTIINNKSKGSFVNIVDGTDSLVLYNNVMVGAKTGGLIIGTPKYLDSASNFINNDVNSAGLKDISKLDFTPLENSPLVDNGKIIKDENDNLIIIKGHELFPYFEYITPVESEISGNKARNNSDGKLDIGAYEYLKEIPSKVDDYNDKVVVFPNPVSDELNLIINKSFRNGEINIIDIIGNEVYSSKMISNLTKINTSKFLQGSYIIVLKLDDISISRKFIVERWLFNNSFEVI